MTTEKDAVKLTEAMRRRLEEQGPLMVVALEAEFADPAAVLRALEAKLMHAGGGGLMKILIVRVGAMGDVLHALPAVAALQVARPDWEIDWVVTPHWSPLLVDGEGQGPVVRRVHLAETKQWSKAPASPATLRSIFELRRALRSESYDLAVDMQGTLRSAVIGRMSGSGQLVGYSDPRESMAAKFYKTKLERKGTHVIEQGAALLGEACGVALEPGGVELPHEEWADNWAAEVVGDRRTCLLAVVPDGGRSVGRWRSMARWLLS